MRTALAVAGVTLLAANLPAQCTTAWIPFGPAPGIGGFQVSASVAWDPDGPGPLPERLVVGGTFTTAGNVLANNIAVWDPATGAWSALGSGCSSNVRALAALPNGDLVAAGLFTQAGGVPVNHIARWDGLAWSPLGGGIDSYPAALTVAANGDLIVGGSFSQAGGVAANRIARWNGTTWSPLGAGSNGLVGALLALPNGDLLATGSFPLPAGATGIARWDGTAWSTLGFGTSGGIACLSLLPNGDVVAGGAFTSAGSVAANNVARWNGLSWSALGSGTSGLVNSLAALPNGDVFASVATSVVRWNGSTWAPLGSGMRGSKYLWPSAFANLSPNVITLATLGTGALIAGGRFSVAGAAAAQNVASWDGAQWSALSTGPGVEAVSDIATLPGGDLVAVGGFAAAGTLVTNAVARWNGATWSNLGNGGTNPGGVVRAAARLPNGDLVVGGVFSSIGGVPATNIARWNGTQWSAMGALPIAEILDLIVSPNGALFAGGIPSFASTSGVVAWNGTTWNAVGAGYIDAYALALLPDGRLVAGGWSSIAVWNGVAWSQLGSGLLDAVKSLAVLPNGDLVAATGYGGPGAGPVVRWDGATWSAIGGFDRDAEVLHVLLNGDLLAGGTFVVSVTGPMSGVARWNGASWSAVGSGIAGQVQVTALTSSPSGDVWVGGTFTVAGGAPSSGIARLTTTCPATAQPQGAGCAGNTVTSTLPWTGSTWRADASGLPNTAAVFVVNGFAPASLSLAAVFPTALPGCTLHVQPDYVAPALAAAGTASAQFVLPNTPALAGTAFHHQMVSLALDATLAVTATNALTLTVGSF